nr:polyadenylate-binding protein 2-like [Ipomoea batatas]GMD52526.1 polyadenylate-binding protein 2-like [Ipomoea batatas]
MLKMSPSRTAHPLDLNKKIFNAALKLPPSSSPLRTASTTDRCAAVLKAEGRPSTTALKAKGRPLTAALKALGRPPTSTTDRQRAALHRPPLLCLIGVKFRTSIAPDNVMRDPNRISKGSTFVSFSTPEEASRVLAEMNSKMINGKPLYVALAQRKEERRARLHAQFAKMRPIAITPQVGTRMPMYPPGGPSLGQQKFYGQPPPALLPPQQLVPGMRPGGHICQISLRQQGQRPGGRRGGSGPMQEGQQPVPMMQQQLEPEIAVGTLSHCL